MYRKAWISAASVLTLAAAAAPVGAVAQSAGGAGESAQLEEVVVTARKVEENLQEVPIAVTAFSGEQLQQQNSTRFSDVARLTPGFTAREANSSPSAFALSIRGQVQTDVLATLDPSVGTYVDGYYWARAYGLNADLLDVQSVQVLKGPQGTLFGRNTSAGALVIQTNNPRLGVFQGELYGAYGRFNERTGRAIVNLPLGDKAALRVAVQKSDRDGYERDVVTGNKYPERDNMTARVKLRVQPTDQLDVVLSAERFEMHAAAPSRHLLFVTPGSLVATTFGAATLNNFIQTVSSNPDTVGLNRRPFTSADTGTYTGTITYDLGFTTLKYIGGYRKVKTFAGLDLDGSQYPIHYTEGGQNLQQSSHELQATGKTLENRLKYVAGAFYFTENGEDHSLSQTIPLLTRYQLFSGTIDNKSWGVYGQGTFAVTDKLSVTGGLRYSSETKGLLIKNRFQSIATGAFTCQIATATPPECELRRSDDFHGISYTASIDYHLTDDALVYATTSSGFRSGGENLRAPQATSFVPFRPEKAKNYEIGLKSEFLDRRVRLNLAAYQTNVTDIQRTSLIVFTINGVPSTATILSNAGRARFRGAEAEVTAVVTPELQLAATGSLIDPKYLAYRDQTGDRSHERFENVAKRSFTLSAQYTKELSLGRLTARADYSWLSAVALQPNVTAAVSTAGTPVPQGVVDATTQPAGGILNARVAMRLPGDQWEVAVFGRNLTDNRDPVSALFVGLGYASAVLREPATYGLQLTYSWGK
ncbi:MAG: TonB-dependent receptor [Phenylobacterium sp.]|nr:TonB-dependent receptor [Phenylobacterium sp.]